MTGHPPVIIIGMHRSGTSMVTRLLEQFGLFVGAQKDTNAESTLFRELNDWLLRQSGASWDQPRPVKLLFGHPETRKLATEYTRRILRSRVAVKHLGYWNFLRFRSPFEFQAPWGWKDPRNTFTLPIWLDLFPDARIIHVFRHGVDVARSLNVRSREGLGESVARFRVPPRNIGIPRGYNGFTDSLRCLTLDGAFSLWEKYLAEARSNTVNLEGRLLTVRYENLLADPVTRFHEMAEFCRLDASDSNIRAAVSGLDQNRAYAYRTAPALMAFAEREAGRLKAYGY